MVNNVKLRSLINSYDSQYYCKITPKLIGELKSISNDSYYEQLSLSERIDLENHILLAEWVSLKPDDIYPYKSIGKTWYSFTDRNKIERQIRIIKQLSKRSGDRYEVKVYFFR